MMVMFICLLVQILEAKSLQLSRLSFRLCFGSSVGCSNTITKPCRPFGTFLVCHIKHMGNEMT